MAVPDDATRPVQETLGALGGIDVLVHNAGAAASGAFLQVSEEVWYHAFNVHVHAAFHLCRAAVPHMIPQKEGAIVLMGSTAGHRGVLCTAAYSLVKVEIPQFTRSLARHLAHHTNPVNSLSPSHSHTPYHT